MQSAIDYQYLAAKNVPSTFDLHRRSIHPSARYMSVPVGSRAFVLTLPAATRSHGQAMLYKEADPILLIWAAEKVAGRRFADLVQTRLWSPIGAEFELRAVRDATGFWTHYLSATAVDMARWCLMMLNEGRVGDTEVVPASFINDIFSNGDVDLLRAEPFVGDYVPDGTAYRSFFYVDSDPDTHAIAAMGGYGQLCYISPKTATAIVIFSSPVPFSEQLARGADLDQVWNKARSEELDRWNLCRMLCRVLASRRPN